MTQLYRVLYCSRNCLAGDAEDVSEQVRRILAASRGNNARDGVTGGLLFSAGCFAQVLEGPSETVEATFERIQCDDRHSDVTVLEAGPVTARMFPDWSMAFTGGDAAAGPLVGGALADAFSGRSDAGSKVLDVLKGVMARETQGLAPRPERPGRKAFPVQDTLALPPA